MSSSIMENFPIWFDDAQKWSTDGIIVGSKGGCDHEIPSMGLIEKSIGRFLEIPSTCSIIGGDILHFLCHTSELFTSS
jgi:hypothetical protein